MPRLNPTKLWLLCLQLALVHTANAEAKQWQDVVRNSPYWVSKGSFNNLKTLRSWVLNSQSFCSNQDRHIIFDKHGAFLGYIDDEPSREQTQIKLNAQRKKMAAQGRVKEWVAGTLKHAGYPFALSCHQPDAQLSVALARYLGNAPSARLWGTWDGMKIGAPKQPVSLHRAINEVYTDRHQKGRISLPPETLSTIAGKTLIESAGKKMAHSNADARGIMQLSVAALNDCNLAERFHFHRLAQVDCALKLIEQNHRNLKPIFDQTFKSLPVEKSQQLYAMLLIQAYHGGVGRVTQLLQGPAINQATQYFVKNQQKFSAEDIALGIIFHNLGRQQLAFASLYYVVDVAIATELVCNNIKHLPGCAGLI